MKKNIHVGELNDALKQLEQKRIQQRADDKAQRKLEMLNEMILQNSLEKQRQKESFKIKALQTEYNKRMRGSLGRVN